MLNIILCEGKTDAILLSYYLLETRNWVYFKGSKFPVRLPIQNKDNESVNWYKNGDNFLVIWGVGGKDNFQYAIDNVTQINFSGNQEQFFAKIAILADRDNYEEDEKINEFNSYFSTLNTQVQLINQQWVMVEFVDSFKVQQQIQLGCLVVPFDGPGAIENFLLKVLCEDKENEILVSAVSNFILSTDSNRYLKSNRQKLKAEFATVLAIMYPEKVFTLMNEFLSSIPWGKYKEFQAGFGLFEEI